MKILHVINSLARGGAERLLADLLPELKSLGFDVALVALDKRGDVFSQGLQKKGVDVRFARELGANPFSPMRVFDLARVMRELCPDVVHAHLGPSFHWCAIASSARRPYALVATEHASANRRMRMPLLRVPERVCYARYDRIACVSEDSAQALIAWLGLEPHKLCVIPNGIPLDRYQGAAPAEDVQTALCGRIGIAMIARFVPAKNHGAALHALSLLPDRYTLVCAGDGPERTAVEAKARSLGVAERCLFLGSRDDVPSVLAASRCALMTSTAEGFGIAALEAMAAGLPLVASEAPGLSRLVEGAGLLCVPHDHAALASAIRRACENEEERRFYIDNGKKRAAQFSIAETARGYARLYATLCGA